MIQPQATLTRDLNESSPIITEFWNASKALNLHDGEEVDLDHLADVAIPLHPLEPHEHPELTQSPERPPESQPQPRQQQQQSPDPLPFVVSEASDSSESPQPPWQPQQPQQPQAPQQPLIKEKDNPKGRQDPLLEAKNAIPKLDFTLLPNQDDNSSYDQDNPVSAESLISTIRGSEFPDNTACEIADRLLGLTKNRIYTIEHALGILGQGIIDAKIDVERVAVIKAIVYYARCHPALEEYTTAAHNQLTWLEQAASGTNATTFPPLAKHLLENMLGDAPEETQLLGREMCKALGKTFKPPIDPTGGPGAHAPVLFPLVSACHGVRQGCKSVLDGLVAAGSCSLGMVITHELLEAIKPSLPSEPGPRFCATLGLTGMMGALSTVITCLEYKWLTTRSATLGSEGEWTWNQRLLSVMRHGSRVVPLVLPAVFAVGGVIAAFTDRSFPGLDKAGELTLSAVRWLWVGHVALLLHELPSSLLLGGLFERAELVHADGSPLTPGERQTVNFVQDCLGIVLSIACYAGLATAYSFASSVEASTGVFAAVGIDISVLAVRSVNAAAQTGLPTVAQWICKTLWSHYAEDDYDLQALDTGGWADRARDVLDHAAVKGPTGMSGFDIGVIMMDAFRRTGMPPWAMATAAFVSAIANALLAQPGERWLLHLRKNPSSVVASTGDQPST